MIRFCGIAIVSVFVLGFAAEAAFGQSTPAPDAPAQPAPAASPAPAATPTAPATAPAASTDKPGGETKAANEAIAPKKKRTKTTRQEVEHSLRSGTVPSRYRSRVPKEYQRYIPFER
jgi:hypothetical protein